MRHDSVLLGSIFLTVTALASSGCARRARVETTPATVAAQAPAYYQPQPTTVLIAQAQQPTVVRGGIIRALTDLGYRMEGEDGQRIVANYTRGRESARIQIEYWPTQATISYLGSTGLRFRPDGSSPHYERWMANLAREIPAHVAVVARQQGAYVGQAVPPGQVIIVQQPAVQAQPVGVQPAQVQPTTVVVEPQPTVVVQPLPTATVHGTIVISN